MFQPLRPVSSIPDSLGASLGFREPASALAYSFSVNPAQGHEVDHVDSGFLTRASVVGGGYERHGAGLHVLASAQAFRASSGVKRITIPARIAVPS